MEIKVPEVGESVFDAILAKWLKEDGAQVRKDEALCELETDKINLEINAEADGVLSIETPEGETVRIGDVIGRLQIDETAAPSTPEPLPEESPLSTVPPKEETPDDTPSALVPPPSGEPRSEELPEPEAPHAAPEGRVTRKPMSRVRKRIAQRLLAARQQTAMLTTFNEADMKAITTLRQKHKADFANKHGISLGYMSFFVKASIKALKDFPDVNARIDGEDIVYQHFYDIGIAIGTDRGLVVPVLRDADRLGFAGIEKAIAAYAQKAQDLRLELSDLTGGTFSISNGGVYGSLLSTPILNPPQCAILGMHAIQDRPVAIQGKVEIRPMMNLALSYDHRLIDGKMAVEFLRRIKELIEDPEEMLLEL